MFFLYFVRHVAVRDVHVDYVFQGVHDEQWNPRCLHCTVDAWKVAAGHCKGTVSHCCMQQLQGIWHALLTTASPPSLLCVTPSCTPSRALLHAMASTASPNTQRHATTLQHCNAPLRHTTAGQAVGSVASLPQPGQPRQPDPLEPG